MSRQYFGSDRMWDSGFRQTPGSRSAGRRPARPLDKLRSVTRMYLNRKITAETLLDWIESIGTDTMKSEIHKPEMSEEEFDATVNLYIDLMGSLQTIGGGGQTEDEMRDELRNIINESGFQ